MNRSQSAFAASATAEEPTYDIPHITRSASETVHISAAGECSYIR